MSDLLSGMLSQFGGPALAQIAKSIGGDEKQTESALGSIIPVLVSALAKNSSTPEGAASLNNALDKDHDGGILDNLTDFLGGGNATAIGGKILGHVLGNKTAAVEGHVSQQTGLSSDAVSSLIKMAAPVVMGYLGKQKAQAGGSSSVLTDMLGAAVQGGNVGGQDSSFITKMLDQNNDGSVMDDVAKIGFSFLGKLFKK
jgi:hypothetical protein